MTIFSRPLVNALAKGKFGKLLALQTRAYSEREFVIREAVLGHRRVRDHLFFYMVQLPFLFFMVPFISYAIWAGEPELQDEPIDRVPHHHEYENTNIRRAVQRCAPLNTQGQHETKIGSWYKHMILFRIRQVRDRILHLQHERQDYKGFAYIPMNDAWVHEAEVKRKQLNVYHPLIWKHHDQL